MACIRCLSLSYVLLLSSLLWLLLSVMMPLAVMSPLSVMMPLAVMSLVTVMMMSCRECTQGVIARVKAHHNAPSPDAGNHTPPHHMTSATHYPTRLLCLRRN